MAEYPEYIAHALIHDEAHRVTIQNWGFSTVELPLDNNNSKTPSMSDSQNSIISACLPSTLRMKREIKQGCKIGWGDVDGK